MIYKLTLPLPPQELHPNARPHWAAKLRATKKARALAKVLALENRVNIGFRYATIQRFYYFKYLRRRDTDNLTAWSKAYLDGIVDAGILLDDDQLTDLPTIKEVDKINPRLELIFVVIKQ